MCITLKKILNVPFKTDVNFNIFPKYLNFINFLYICKLHTKMQLHNKKYYMYLVNIDFNKFKTNVKSFKIKIL